MDEPIKRFDLMTDERLDAAYQYLKSQGYLVGKPALAEAFNRALAVTPGEAQR